jgi:hypothetical protein
MRQPGAVQAAAHGPLPMAFAYPHTPRRRWRRLRAGEAFAAGNGCVDAATSLQRNVTEASR